MTSPAVAKTLIIGVGNEFRGDDGAGLLVARALVSVAPMSIKILELPGEGTELMQVWQGRQNVIVIDASQSGAQLGEIRRLNATSEPLPTGFFSYSTHAFGLAEAVETSRNLNTLPQKLIIYAIEGNAFAQGAVISSEVSDVVKTVTTSILAEIS